MKYLPAVLVLSDLVLQSYFHAVGYGVLNRGVSFGLFQGLEEGIAVLIYGLFVLFYLKSSRKDKPSLRWLAAGGLGNLLPRLYWGGVWDYLHVPFMPFRFNISDIMITLGIIYYILGMYYGNPHSLRRQGQSGHQ